MRPTTAPLHALLELLSPHAIVLSMFPNTPPSDDAGMINAFAIYSSPPQQNLMMQIICAAPDDLMSRCQALAAASNVDTCSKPQ